ncbi:MAG: fumarylacetoacetate hydrolase family protein [Chloroflexota bacterium]|nr:fumarylacetoacetate hydrolase family protein [Chloroflexota bacterium]
MKLVTFEIKTPLGAFDRIGAMVEEQIVDLTLGYATYLADVDKQLKALDMAAALLPPDMLSFLDGGDGAMAAAKTTVAYLTELVSQGKEITAPNGGQVVHGMDEVKLKAPLPNPRLMVDFSTFESHIKMGCEKMGVPVPKAWYELPIGYKVNLTSIVGTEEDLLFPSFTQMFDYELEFAIVIGKKGKDIPEEKAYEYVAGYTVCNDVSARDIEMQEIQAMPLGPIKGKDFDTGTVLGPCITTHDEIGDPHNLEMLGRVNGELWTEASTKDMYWSIPQLIAHLSKDQTLYPGSMFLSGTPGGGCGLHFGKVLKPGDVVELEIEKIGVIRNKVIKP